MVDWRSEAVDQGGYDDFTMIAPNGGEEVAGICHARGEIADLPPQWLAYLVVADLDESIRRCVELGGSLVAGPKGDAGSGRYCVIRDPAGAVVALIDEDAAAWQSSG